MNIACGVVLCLHLAVCLVGCIFAHCVSITVINTKLNDRKGLKLLFLFRVCSHESRKIYA